MFVEDLKNDFYNVLLGNRVLLLVHYDVDAICTCKILQGLFKSDNISYTLVPIGGISELKSAYQDNNEEIKYVVLINCGGTIDLVDILQPEENVVFFVLDAHKPTNICNVYSVGQVRLVYRDNDEEIPNYEDLYSDDEDDDEDNVEAETGRQGLEAAVERRRKKRAWEEKRDTLMFKYTQFSYYGKPSCLVALELSRLVSRWSPAVAWAACAGAAAQEALCLRPPASTLLDNGVLHNNHQNQEASVQVVVEKDAWLPLYRSWSVEGALRHAPTVAPHLRLHTAAGGARLRQLLADMGLPLRQARQRFGAMDVELRRGLVTALEQAAQRMRLPPPTRAALLLRRTHRSTLAALDLVYGIIALIHHENMPAVEGFHAALRCLEVEGGAEERARAAAAAQRALEAVARLVHGALASGALRLAGPFAYLIVSEGPDAWAVRGPAWLALAARWLAPAVGARPLLASVSTDADSCLLLGVPPNFTDEPRNLFGTAFEEAAVQSGVTLSMDYMDTSIVRLPTSQRAKFLDALTALLA